MRQFALVALAASISAASLNAEQAVVTGFLPAAPSGLASVTAPSLPGQEQSPAAPGAPAVPHVQSVPSPGPVTNEQPAPSSPAAPQIESVPSPGAVTVEPSPTYSSSNHFSIGALAASIRFLGHDPSDSSHHTASEIHGF